MNISLYQVDAFASDVFEGNPAAVCPLDGWLPDELMQQIALENNLSETAFFVKAGQGYQLRWFTPATEVDLCGHATLGSAHVLFEHLGYDRESIVFDTRSGELEVCRRGRQLVMDFPAARLNAFDPPAALEEALQVSAVKVYRDMDILCVVEDGERLQSIAPDFQLLGTIDTRGVIVTAPSTDERFDFISRFFAPAAGVNEDPVTGSAHTILVPYWSRTLHQKELVGRQVSARGGTVFCEDRGRRVLLAGEACTYLEGQITI
ncbi:PhzF family phenazine biosynthesis protein [Fodinibius sediminis]|uniref:Phenazine biosynthesis protein PhzF family n=1 Tax=Fodinibius sediminis TaxID=1214077 RepID=A0A521C5D1_9BACT|nr:PhzF family phenazine biosynthesis protein [Fodinibius sediminis]SMO54603.1 phenazine biosynthesis protein PhzF family [Fodinibius sediminis]